jgi:KipI family sensor histidine kinase inhibitor
MSGVRIVAAGDSAMLVEFPVRLDRETNARALSLARGVADRWGRTLRDIVVGFCSVTMYFDPLVVDGDALEADVRAVDAGFDGSIAGHGRTIEVPVCYGGAYGPDLAEVAARAEMSESDVAALHTGSTYRVFMVGFLPGFAYMASLDPRISLARRPTPRVHVPAGSVAIAAGQTGIYPTDSPGGWHLIGRTHLKPYDPGRADPFLFRAGDEVRFRAIDRQAFETGRV